MMHENKPLAPTIPPPHRSHEVPGSTSAEKIFLHPATLQLVRTLLPGRQVNGCDILLALLAYATPDAHGEVAIVRVQSVQRFSAQPQWPWGYTTTCKILLVLEALGILERHRHHHTVEFRIHLGPPPGDVPQICRALDRLIARKTLKVQRLAARVKETLQQRNMPIRNAFPKVHYPAMLQPVTDYLGCLLEAHGVRIPFSRRRELVRASQVIAHLLCPATYPAPSEENFTENLPLPKIPKEHAHGETEIEQREFFISVGIPDSAGNSLQGDLELLVNAAEPSAQALVGNSSFEETSEFPAMPKNSPAEEQIGNSSFQITFNVNRNNIAEKEENENVVPRENPLREQEGNLLARAVEGHAANAMAYKHYLAQYDPRTVLAAFVYLKQRQYGQKHRPIDSPGAYFNTVLKAWSAFGPYDAACEAYEHACAKTEGVYRGRKCHQLPGIPADVQELVRHFWRRSYDEIAAALQEELIQQAVPTGNSFSTWGKTQVDPWLGGQERLREPRYVPKQWMDRDEALRLMERISREARTIPDLSLQLAPEPRLYSPKGVDQTVYLVDLVIERVPQVYAEPAQWHTYYRDVQACF